MKERQTSDVRPRRGQGRMGLSRESMKKCDIKALKWVLGKLFRKYRVLLIFGAAGIALSAFANLYIKLFLQTLLDDYIIPLTGAENPDFGPLLHAIFTLVKVLAAGIISIFISQLLIVYASQGTMRDIRKELFKKMESLPVSYFDTRFRGDIMSVYTNDVDTLRQLISQSVPQLAGSVVTVLTTFAGMLMTSVPLTVVSAVMIAVSLFVTTRLSGLSGKYFAEQQKNLGRTNGFVEEMVSGQKVIKVFTHEQQSVAEFSELNEELRKAANSASRTAHMMMPVNGSIGKISYVLCAIIGAVIASTGNGMLTIGALVSFLTLNNAFTHTVTRVSMQLASVVMAAAGAGRIRDVMNEKPEPDDGYVTLVNMKTGRDGKPEEAGGHTNLWAWKNTSGGKVEYRMLSGKVELKDVDFSYDGKKQVLFDISMYATAGQKVALVGNTGAGKTTITNLINRFYDIGKGEILFDDIDIRKIRKPDLRRSLAVVLQHTSLFSGTVMDNIRFGRLDATDAECIEAAKLANAHEFISHLPDGYQTCLHHGGSSLSQGQCQLLSIARAIVADPPALILDEATSSIDTRTEALVQKGMDALMAGRTTFVIAHRLSTIQDADCIMVMEDGRIVERGTHLQLLERKGRYYRLYTGMNEAM